MIIIVILLMIIRNMNNIYSRKKNNFSWRNFKNRKKIYQNTQFKYKLNKKDSQCAKKNICSSIFEINNQKILISEIESLHAQKNHCFDWTLFNQMNENKNYWWFEKFFLSNINLVHSCCECIKCYNQIRF